MSCYVPRCIPSKKYLVRKSPPFSATNCHVGAIEKGNDNNLYQVVLRKGAGGLTQKWAKCFTKGTTCPAEYDLSKSKKVIVKSKAKVKVKAMTKTPCKAKAPAAKSKTIKIMVKKTKAKAKAKAKAPTKAKAPAKAKAPTKAKTIKIKVKKTKVKDKAPTKAKAPAAKGKVLYDVKKNGVMLAHTFKDPRTGKIKGAPKGCAQAPNGWYLSEKYDGYRAIWNGQEFVSRAGNVFATPDYFKEWLPTNEALDGELFMGRENFEKCGLFRKKEVDHEAWKKANITYQIFDSPTMSGMFEERTAKIKKLIKDQCKSKSGKCPLKMTKQIKVTSEADVKKHFDKLVAEGAEGVMLRAPNSPYDKKRSSNLLKVKQLFDAECKIVGYKMGTGKYAKMLGAFNCELVKNKKINFTISGMDDTIRQNYMTTHPLGTIVTFTYMGLSEKGVPRHPNYLRKRM